MALVELVACITSLSYLTLHVHSTTVRERGKPPCPLHPLSEVERQGESKKNFKTIILEGMNTANNHDERIAKMTFASVYPLYLAKVEKKGRTKGELHQLIEWLTGYDEKKLQKLINNKVSFEEFFQKASLNPNAHLITGVICGYRIEEIENPLTKQVRYLDKLVDELAKGRKLDKILRSE